MVNNRDTHRHQLFIHLDYGPALGGRLEVKYSYPFNHPFSIPEQLVRIEERDIEAELRAGLDYFLERLLSRAPQPRSVRLPHQTVTPQRQVGVMTIVAQEQRRKLPVARLYVYDRVFPAGTGSPQEIEVRMEPGDFSQSDLQRWRSLRQHAKAISWAEYQRLLGASGLTSL